MKPNFTIVLIPTLGTLLLVRMVTTPDRREQLVRLGHVAAALVPSVAVLAFRYAMTFSRDEPFGIAANSLVVDPLHQWNTFTDDITLSIIRSILVPLVVTAVWSGTDG